MTKHDQQAASVGNRNDRTQPRSDRFNQPGNVANQGDRPRQRGGNQGLGDRGDQGNQSGRSPNKPGRSAESQTGGERGKEVSGGNGEGSGTSR